MSTTETPEALQRQLTATANELIRAHARIRTLEAEVRRLKERLLEKTEKIAGQAEEET